jgi:hypothetical protein
MTKSRKIQTSPCADPVAVLLATAQLCLVARCWETVPLPFSVTLEESRKPWCRCAAGPGLLGQSGQIPTIRYEGQTQIQTMLDNQ